MEAGSGSNMGEKMDRHTNDCRWSSSVRRFDSMYSELVRGIDSRRSAEFLSSILSDMEAGYQRLDELHDKHFDGFLQEDQMTKAYRTLCKGRAIVDEVRMSSSKESKKMNE